MNTENIRKTLYLQPPGSRYHKVFDRWDGRATITVNRGAWLIWQLASAGQLISANSGLKIWLIKWLSDHLQQKTAITDPSPYCTIKSCQRCAQKCEVNSRVIQLLIRPASTKKRKCWHLQPRFWGIAVFKLGSSFKPFSQFWVIHFLLLCLDLFVFFCIAFI